MKGLLGGVITFFVLLAAGCAADLAVVRVTAAARLDPKDQSSPDFVAGEEFSVFFNEPLPNAATVHLGLELMPLPGATPAAVPTAEAAAPLPELPHLLAYDRQIRVRLPKNQPPGIYKLVYTVTTVTPLPAVGAWTDSSVAVVVWPLPNATVTEISPKPLRPGSVVKVSGTGFSAPASRISFVVGGVPAKITRVDPEGRWFAASIVEGNPKKSGDLWERMIRPAKGVQISVWDIPATTSDDFAPKIERPVHWVWTVSLFLLAGGFVALIGLLIKKIYDTWPDARNWIAAALIETKNNTYSLARAQFLWWLTIITWAYLFLFLGRGWVEGFWGFPPLSGFAYTFLISLGTLVAGEVTSSVRGVKGAGPVSPSASDLIMHGGVLALERVQQVMWTVVVGLMFLFITVKTYSTSTALPTIPNELLTLMGFSSLGYIAGKTARKPGPVVSRATLVNGTLEIVGENFSAVGVRVQVDGGNVESQITTRRTPGTSGDYVQGLVVPLTAEQVATWAQKSHVVTVTNADDQYAEWQSPARLAKVASISPPAGNGTVDVVIVGENVKPGSILKTDDGKGGEVTGVADAADPGRWTLTVDQGWPAAAHVLELETPDGTSTKANWPANMAAGAAF